MPLPRKLLRMTTSEIQLFLTTERTCRVATVSKDGTPHVVPLWFLWQDERLHLSSLRKTARGANLARGSEVSICIDAGATYSELCGVVLYGTLAHVEHAELLASIKRAFAMKYFGITDGPDLRSYDWLVLDATKVVSWDFKKIPAGKDLKTDLPSAK